MITDEDIVYDALRRYTAWRQDFALQIHQPGAEKSDGTLYTDEEKSLAIQLAKQCDRLTQYAKEKVESPIILMQ